MADTGHKTTAELRELLRNGQTAEEKSLAEKGHLCARERMRLLFDEGTFVEVGRLHRTKTDGA